MLVPVLDAIALAVAVSAALWVLGHHRTGTLGHLVGLLCLALGAIAAGGLVAGFAPAPARAMDARFLAALATALVAGTLVALGAAMGLAPRRPWPIVLGVVTTVLVILGGVAVAPTSLAAGFADHRSLLDGTLRRVFGGIALALASGVFGAGALGARRKRSPTTQRRLLAAVGIQGAAAVLFLVTAALGSSAMAVGVPLAVILLAAGHGSILWRYRPAVLPGDAFAGLFERARAPMVFVNVDAGEARANLAASELLGPVSSDPDGLVERLGLGPSARGLDAHLGAGRPAAGLDHVVVGTRTFDLSLVRNDRDRVLLVILSEVTERVRAREAAEQALADLADAHERMVVQEKMAALGSLISGISHEINNPVAYVSSNLRVLREYLDETTEIIANARSAGDEVGATRALVAWARSHQTREMLDDAAGAIDDGLDGCERIRTIVSSMRTLSRENEPEGDTDLAELSRQAVKVARTSVHPSIHVLAYLGEPLPVRAVPGEISRVVSNLVVNAGHAVGEAGTITIAGWTEGGTCVVEVADDGPGIPEALRTRIFEPFFTTKGPGQGTGLGLSISYETVRRHGGELLVHSTLGEGSRFQVRLPIAAVDDGPVPRIGGAGAAVAAAG